MGRLVLTGLLLACSAVLAAADGRKPVVHPASPGADTVSATDPVLRAALDRIYRRSQTWRAAIDDLAVTGRRALVLTPAQVVVREAADGGRAEAFDPGTLAAVSPVPDVEGRVSVVLVVVNLPLLEALHERRGSLPAEVEADLDRLLAHEIYGHALPLLSAGHVSGRCPDPAPGQRATDACAVQRENVIRAELSLGRRTDAGHQGLLLSFRGRH